MRRVAATVAAVLALTAAGCASPRAATRTEILVFAAASLKESFTTIGTDFERAHRGARVRFNFGPSDGLAAGIKGGAPADVFATASEATMDVVEDSPGVSRRTVFARNKLVLIAARTSRRVYALSDIARQGVKLVVAAQGVPAGKYARQILENANLREAMRNIVSNEIDVKSVVQKVVLGEADAGFVYVTDVTPSVAKNVRTIAIPDALNVVASYPIALVSSSPTARAFLDYVLAPGQTVLHAAGFLPPA